MIKKVFITTDFKRIDKTKWPFYVKDFFNDPDINSLHRYSGKIFLKRFQTESFPRILFLEETDDQGNKLYVPRKFFERHDKYDEFFENDQSIILRKTKYSPSENQEIKQEFLKLVEVEGKPSLPEKMRTVENHRDFSNISTSYVYEMEEWVSHLKSDEFEDDKKEIFEVLQKFIIDKIYPAPDESGWITLKFANDKEIVGRISDKDNHTHFYLFDIAEHVDKDLLENKYLQLSSAQLPKQARKGYPDWILCGDFIDWKKLENDDEANLALSEEEVNVLDNTPYPYFINGLAGSGKSTILYYLFAHAYSYQANSDTKLMFLSYSKKLIQKAQIVVKALLRHNPSYTGFKLTEDEERKLENCFSPFQDFLKNQFLTSEEEIEKFSSSHHMNYEEFKKRYKEECKLPESKIYNSTIVWSVIRSFIKGRHYNSYFTIDEYRNINRDDRTVEPKDYEIIYRIWNNWYRQYENTHWDDLDLVRFVLTKLESGFVMDKYDIIYCDEAQDFTPIENQLILKLSKYSDFDLSDYKKIPIAYAGDPNQTISPTGFSWNRLKDIFSKSFVEQVGDYISLKDKTLNNNYRSKRTIVEFANSIQYIRKHFLTDDVLQPQEQWNPQENPIPGFFYLDTEEDRDFISQGFEKAECIITGEDGEYEKQLDSNELTPESTEIKDTLLLSIDNKTKLYTAISSKGLEFKAVLLYKFANNLPASFSRILNHEKIDSESEKYELAHFFTKLYIAVSRAKELLYVIDTKENFESFWKYFIDNAFVNNLMKSLQDANSWTGKIGGIEIGKKDEYLRRLEENFNPLELAQKIYADAKINQDSKDMRRAAGYFAEANRNKESEECKAYVLLYEKNYEAAGEKFSSLGKFEESTLAYWSGGCWSELAQNAYSQPYKKTAMYMTKELSLIDFIKINSILDYFSVVDETWKKVVINIVHDSMTIDKEYISVLCDFLDQLSVKGFKTVDKTIANLLFANKQWRKAVERWDELHDTEHVDYYRAKKELADSTSESIFWMNKLKEYGDIVSKWGDPEDIKNLGLNEQAQQIIFNILLVRNYDKAVSYPYPSNEDEKFNRLFKGSKENKQKFLQSFLLKDFSMHKFEEFAAKMAVDTAGFEDAFNKDVLDGIFSLVDRNENDERRPYWMYFFIRLKDSENRSIIKYYVDRNHLMDSLAKVLKTNDDYNFASCFLDNLFSSDFDFKYADKYSSTLQSIFTSKKFVITRDDFRKSVQKNYFFSQCNLQEGVLDHIKNGLNDYAKKKIESYSKFKSSDEQEVMTLCYMYEISINYNNITPDYSAIISFYKKMMKKDSSKDLNSYFIKRFIVNNLFLNNVNNAGCLSYLISTEEEYHGKINVLLNSLPKQEAIHVSSILLCENDSRLTSYIRELARLFYKHKIHLNDMKQFYSAGTKNDQIKEILKNMVSMTLAEELSNQKIDEYNVKLLAFVIELIEEKRKDVAIFYEKLMKNTSVSNTPHLLRYCKLRALSKYQHLKQDVFRKKKLEFGIDPTSDMIPNEPIIIPVTQSAVPSVKIKFEPILQDCIIGEYGVELIPKRKKVTFVKDDDEVLIIAKGAIEIKNSNLVSSKGSICKLQGGLEVIVASAESCSVSYKEKNYKIEFK